MSRLRTAYTLVLRGVRWYMEIRGYQENHLPRLFEYWRKVGAKIPYFFPVSARKWQTCLLEDELDGERIFKNLETYFAAESGQVLGFVQYGQPNFAWDGRGQKYNDPNIGLIRTFISTRGVMMWEKRCW